MVPINSHLPTTYWLFYGPLTNPLIRCRQKARRTVLGALYIYRSCAAQALPHGFLASLDYSHLIPNQGLLAKAIPAHFRTYKEVYEETYHLFNDCPGFTRDVRHHDFHQWNAWHGNGGAVLTSGFQW